MRGTMTVFSRTQTPTGRLISMFPMRGTIPVQARNRDVCLTYIHVPHAGNNSAILRTRRSSWQLISMFPMRGTIPVYNCSKNTTERLISMFPMRGTMFPFEGEVRSVDTYIHVPHAGNNDKPRNLYPCSPCGEQLIPQSGLPSAGYLYPCSPYGEQYLICVSNIAARVTYIHVPHAGNNTVP